MFSVGKAPAAPSLALVTRCATSRILSERSKLFRHRASGTARYSYYPTYARRRAVRCWTEPS